MNKKLCIIIGYPVHHSLSPHMHNAAYEALGIADSYEYLAEEIRPEDLEKTIKKIKEENIRGITVTIPHKINIMQYLDKIDDIAKKIGAVNTIVNDKGKLIGYNTDWLGVLHPLEQIIDINNKKVAVLGAGGFAHAAVYATTYKEGQVTIFNRTVEKAKEIAEKYNINYEPLENINKIYDMDIIINASSVGLESDESIVPENLLNKKHVVFDAVYVPYETKLLKDAKKVGAKVIHGTELLLYQGVKQFELFTNQKAPVDIMRKTLISVIPSEQNESRNLSRLVGMT